MPFISVYNAIDMEIIWAQGFGFSQSNIRSITLSPDGSKIAAIVRTYSSFTILLFFETNEGKILNQVLISGIESFIGGENILIDD